MFLMDIEHDEARDDEKQIDTCVSHSELTAFSANEQRLIGLVGKRPGDPRDCMGKHNTYRRDGAQCLDRL
jgi:hypothetical protein